MSDVPEVAPQVPIATRIQQLEERIERLRNDLDVGLSNAHAREVGLASALERTQLAIDALGSILKSPDWMGRLERLAEREHHYENVREALEELVEAASQRLTAMRLHIQILERREPPWWQFWRRL